MDASFVQIDHNFYNKFVYACYIAHVSYPLIPWKSGKPLAWDVTVPDTYAASHFAATAESAGAAANKAAANKISKYSTLATTHHFVPISVEI